ncbi:MAG: CRISPR-associated endoribonuclease Cas6 [Ignavibacteria bacterium]|jgi:CRISPR-associated endoribonuclease Cas6|nr:CRISPR-associated endoribonuclease Cas6 [Ignavibacteria bacterium]MCU7504665.1 CRISPR-associated endoribonuclease Cas6 [Ignavibacteria bacterium]MCU7517527.1 CRISPR-associated endoribonuclease Cas6 [Ignavibacteria bacterium]
MRLQIRLKAADKELTFNYNYPLFASIYSLLRLGSEEFSAFLHDKGYRIDSKTYKLYTFALRLEKAVPLRDRFLLKSSSADLYISSPKIEEFIQAFVMGSFEKQVIKVNDGYTRTEFCINSVEVLPEPEFTGEMSFSLLSPMVISTVTEANGKLQQYYFRYYDDISEINRVLTNNLINKYRILNGKEISGAVRLEWDEDYIRYQESRGKKLTRKVTIHSNRNGQTEVIGNMLPFRITGTSELIKTGYECGFGEKNSMGFGMGEIRS